MENKTVGTLIDHPFHIHVNPFQVTEVFDPNAPLLDSHGFPVRKDGKCCICGQHHKAATATRPMLVEPE